MVSGMPRRKGECLSSSSATAATFIPPTKKRRVFKVDPFRDLAGERVNVSRKIGLSTLLVDPKLIDACRYLADQHTVIRRDAYHLLNVIVRMAIAENSECGINLLSQHFLSTVYKVVADRGINFTCNQPWFPKVKQAFEEIYDPTRKGEDGGYKDRVGELKYLHPQCSMEAVSMQTCKLHSGY